MYMSCMLIDPIVGMICLKLHLINRNKALHIQYIKCCDVIRTYRGTHDLFEKEKENIVYMAPFGCKMGQYSPKTNIYIVILRINTMAR